MSGSGLAGSICSCLTSGGAELEDAVDLLLGSIAAGLSGGTSEGSTRRAIRGGPALGLYLQPSVLVCSGVGRCSVPGYFAPYLHLSHAQKS